ncbi:TIGR02679 family protein [Kyrpidia sp.]|uniref:TIGR02679 family protein n=1 Tax=Kyrpidia sp. TaxID=2073077 RepID=UPI00258C85D1|nr:TIGR02679 family protein [Kyrpidia sp.]
MGDARPDPPQVAEMREQLRNYLVQPGLARLWPAARDKFERLGRVAGRIRLTGLASDERNAIGALLAANLYGREEVSLRLADLDRALRETRFGVDLVTCLRLLYGDLHLRPAERAADREAWIRFCDWVRRTAVRPWLEGWVDRLCRSRGPGYRTFLECYKTFRASGRCPEWEWAARALSRVPLGSPVRLPVLAAETAGDPHGLDRDRLAGRVFYWGLVAWAEDPQEEELEYEGEPDILAPTERTRRLYDRAGVRLDDISSVVWVAGWPGLSDLPAALPLFTLEQVRNIPPVSEVHVVENPAVFASLYERIRVDDGVPARPLVCPSGQPSAAALKLLDAVAEKGQIWYSGDFDPQGLQMALALKERYGSRFRPWRLDRETYLSVDHPGLPDITPDEDATLGRLTIPWDLELIPTMRTRRRKVFQEQLLERLAADLESHSPGPAANRPTPPQAPGFHPISGE